jgi:glycine/D-amino acid oxidase-like deaminating enzyme
MNATVRSDLGATWYAAQAAPLERPRLTYDLDVDVCVIGAGLAGLTAAREIARRGWSVAVLEARRVAWSASGRNCGFVVPGFGADIRHMVERTGLERAKALWKLSEAGVDYVRAAVRETLPEVAPESGWLDVSKVDSGDELLSIATLLGQEFGAEIEGWPTERVRAVLKTDHYFHAIHYPGAFTIDPLAYAHGLANAALAAGAMIFEETPALAIDPAGVRKRVRTPNGRVRAPHVVLAGNAHLGTLAPRLAETVLPVTGYVAVSAPLGERLGEAIAFRGAVSDSRHANHHYRIVGGDRLMWAGGGAIWPPSPRRAVRRFAAAIAQTFPRLGAVEFEYAWAGVMGFSVHRMPQVGEVVPGLWLASAFGAHGLNVTAIAGELIATAITERDDRWRLFLPYELVWAGGILGRAVHHVGAWSRRAGEDFAASLSRRREAVRRAEEQGMPTLTEPGPGPVVAVPAHVQPETHIVPAQTVPAGPPSEAEVSALVPEVESLLRAVARSGAAEQGAATVAAAQHETEESAEPQEPPATRAPDADAPEPENPPIPGISQPRR